MSLPNSGTISILQIQQEFSRGLDLNSYRGTGRWKDNRWGSFPGGTISFSDFYGCSSDTVTIELTGTVSDFNLRTYLTAMGWSPSISTVSATVNVRGTVLASSTSTYAFDTGILPEGSSVTLNIFSGAYIVGMGGKGGDGVGSGVCGCVTGNPGLNGGPALRLQVPTTLTNNGVIGGGGGGGGSGGAECWYIWNASPGAGGGGAGFGVGGVSSACGVTLGRRGGNGGTGSLLTGGAGGTRGNQFQAIGGAGGALGQAGSTGGDISFYTPLVYTYTDENNNLITVTQGKVGGAGGQPGSAIVGISNYLPGSLGDIRGPTS